MIAVCLSTGISETLATANCPASVATIDKGILSPIVSKIMSNLYKELGCQMELLPLPGRRGILSFNAGQVDGEVIRLAKAEAAYKRKFVRSSEPLYNLTFSLWSHPEASLQGALPIGYTLGVLWQEDYMTGKRGRRFHSADKLFTEYNAGRLSGFLAADISVVQLIESGKIVPAPKKVITILTAPMYHYLGREFSPFMDRLTALIKVRNSFSAITELQNR